MYPSQGLDNGLKALNIVLYSTMLVLLVLVPDEITRIFIRDPSDRQRLCLPARHSMHRSETSYKTVTPASSSLSGRWEGRLREGM